MSVVGLLGLGVTVVLVVDCLTIDLSDRVVDRLSAVVSVGGRRVVLVRLGFDPFVDVS